MTALRPEGSAGEWRAWGGHNTLQQLQSPVCGKEQAAAKPQRC